MKQDGKTDPENRVSANRMMKGKPADSPGGQAGIAGEQERSWHMQSAEEVARALQSDPTNGLTNAEAARRRKQFGPNALAAAKGRSVLTILVGQFKSLIVALLVGVTVLAFALGENIEAVAVLVVIVLNAVVGFLTESKAEQALTARNSRRCRRPTSSGRGRSTRSPRPSWCPATSSSSPPGRACRPTGGSSRAYGCKWRRPR